MRDLTTTETEQCAGGAPMQGGFARPTNTSRSIIAHGPQGRDNQRPFRDVSLAAAGPVQGGFAKPD